MKHLISILGILFIGFLWILPLIMLTCVPSFFASEMWGIIYIPIVALTICWGAILYQEYYYIKSIIVN